MGTQVHFPRKKRKESSALNSDALDPAVIEKERQVQIDIAKESGKPDAVIEKMIVGRLNKFFQEVCLLKQTFVINPDLTVEKAVAEAGADIKIVGFARVEVGEGVVECGRGGRPPPCWRGGRRWTWRTRWPCRSAGSSGR